MTRRSLYLAVATVFLATVARCEQGRWLNVEVNERGDDTEVRLHLPMSMVLAVLDAVDTQELRHGKVHICTAHNDVDWQAVLRELRSAPEGEYVAIQGHEANLTARKLGGIMEMKVDEHGASGDRVNLRIPVDLLDALTIHDDSTVDIKTLVARLGDTTGEILKVESEDADVRIWVE